jgi:hypothetical protein
LEKIADEARLSVVPGEKGKRIRFGIRAAVREGRLLFLELPALGGLALE